MVSEQVWKQEEDYLALVSRRIREELERLEATVSHRNESAVEIRKHFWDEISVNVDNMDEMVETLASIRQQSMVLKSYEHGLNHAQKQLSKLEKMEPSPYFGRIDFKDQGESEAESIYIGIGSLISDDTGEALVFDWRAPIAGLFYDYSTGPASYDTPEGQLSGEIELKRQYVIEQGKLISVFDTGLHIGDDMLRRMLDRHADDRMKNIVSTIQREQNEIIRDESRNVLIVQGTAGSGKTSAALQRIAYLLYQHRKSVGPDQMLLFTPNDIFQDYVSSVLPELGESNVPQSTFYELASHRLGEELRVEHPYDHLERSLTTGTDPQQEASIRYRSSLDYLKVLDDYVERLASDGIVFRPLMAGSRVLVSVEAMHARFYDTLSSKPLRGRIHGLEEWLAGIVREYRQAAEKRWYRKLMKEPGYIGTKEEIAEMAKRRAKKRASKLMGWVKRHEYVDRVATYTQFLKEEEVAKRIQSGDIPYEETASLIYFFGRLEGFPTYNRIRYVLVDEVQDYSPIQLALIKQLFPRARMTFLGDLNQAVFADTGFASYKVFESLFGHEEVKMIRLTKSYRSTQDILDYCREILPQGEESEAYGRRGVAPTAQGYASQEAMRRAIVERVQELQAEGMGSIAIICRTEADAVAAHEQLKATLELQLITRASRKFEGALPLVIPSYMAKGLEFDAVIVYEASADVYQREGDRKLLYTVGTRALHRLHIYYTGEPSPFVPERIAVAGERGTK